MTLLIVDDSELIRSRLRRMFEAIPGIDAIHTAATRAQALERVRCVVPTLVVLDFQLPDGNAIQIIKVIKQRASGMQFAVLTNDACAFNRDKCLQAGANWFFDKSTEFEALRDLVQQQAALN